MPFENNGTLKKWQMRNTPPEIDKYDSHKEWCLTLQKWHTFLKIFKRKFLNLFDYSDS